MKDWTKTFNKRLKSDKKPTKDEQIKILENEIHTLYNNMYPKKNPTKTFIGGIVCTLIVIYIIFPLADLLLAYLMK